MSFLILHKVRGQPAFDIAEPMQIGDEHGWIIPTSGHRAYPYWQVEIETDEASCWLAKADYIGVVDFPKLPDNWPDHYSCNDRPVQSSSSDITLEDLEL
jgi:hypothetical protein